MGRPVVLSNGSLFVGLNEDGLVHDFYFPYVGLENLTTARSMQHKIGVWVDGDFRWTDDGTWDITVDFEPEALISDIYMKSTELNVTLKFVDFVDQEINAFIRKIELINHADRKRDIRLFMHQVFQISRSGRADTAMYVPDDHYLLDYKGRCCLLTAGHVQGNGDFDQFAVGNYGIEGKSGTFKDAEDGELSGNLVEHGGVDSVLRFQKHVSPGGSFKVDYWVAAGTSQSEVQLVHTKIKYHSVDDRLSEVRKTYKKWLEPAVSKISHINEPHRTALLKSLLIIKAHCDSHGSVLASGDSSIFNYGRDYYCYCWPRDAAYALWPLIRLGIYDEAKQFFDFARGTLHVDGYLMHKYQPDRAIGSTWHPMLHGRVKELAIQEDETASVLFMMGEYFEATGDRQFVESYYNDFIFPAASFLTGFVDDSTNLPHASYDLWEERFLTTTYTVSVVIAGLEAAAKMAEAIGREEETGTWRLRASKIKESLNALYHPDGYFRKGYLLEESGDLSYNDTLDISSLYGPFMYARLPRNDERLMSTAKAVEERLLNSSPIGGVVRYEQDNYFRTKTQYPGNPWIVCTMWLAQYYAHQDQNESAKELVDWALERQINSGVLSEQYDPEDGSLLSVAPLVWSHAELVNTILDIYET